MLKCLKTWRSLLPEQKKESEHCITWHLPSHDHSFCILLLMYWLSFWINQFFSYLFLYWKFFLAPNSVHYYSSLDLFYFFWATCSRQPCLSSRVGPGNLQRPLLPSTITGFCGSTFLIFSDAGQGRRDWSSTNHHVSRGNIPAYTDSRIWFLLFSDLQPTSWFLLISFVYWL